MTSGPEYPWYFSFQPAPSYQPDPQAGALQQYWKHPPGNCRRCSREIYYEDRIGGYADETGNAHCPDGQPHARWATENGDPEMRPDDYFIDPITRDYRSTPPSTLGRDLDSWEAALAGAKERGVLARWLTNHPLVDQHPSGNCPLCSALVHYDDSVGGYIGDDNDEFCTDGRRHLAPGAPSA